jgi:hypothetical protein
MKLRCFCGRVANPANAYVKNGQRAYLCDDCMLVEIRLQQQERMLQLSPAFSRPTGK